MATGRLCQSFLTAGNESRPATILDSPSADGGEDDTLIPSWDDSDDLIRKIFEEEDDGFSCRGDDDDDDNDDDDEWQGNEHCSQQVDENHNESEQNSSPPWAEKHGPMLPYARNQLPVISSSDESDEEEAYGQQKSGNQSSSDDEASNAENRSESYPRSGMRHGQSNEAAYRFSLPKHLLQKSTKASVRDATTIAKPLATDISKAVRFPTPGEVWIRADLLQRHQLPEV